MTGLDLSKATSLVEIGENAFSDTILAGTLLVPNTVTKIGPDAFDYTKLALFPKATSLSLFEVGENAFSDTTVRKLRL